MTDQGDQQFVGAGGAINGNENLASSGQVYTGGVQPVPNTPSLQSVAQKKPLTLEDLAAQTPIFSDAEMEEDDFDPWAPLDDVKNEEPKFSKVEEVNKEVVVENEKGEIEKREIEATIPVKDLEEEEESDDVIEGSLVDEDGVDPFDGLEPDDDNLLKDFFKNLNLNGKKVVGCVVAFSVIIILIIALIFGGKFLLKKLSEGKVAKVKEVEKVEKVEKEVVKQKDVEIDSSRVEDKTDVLPVGWIDPSLYTGVRVGMQSAEGAKAQVIPISDSTGIALSPSKENITVYVDILSKIRVFYKTDIQAMLNSSNDRNRTLNNFLSNMRSVSEEAHNSLSEIQIRKSKLQEEFDAVSTEKQIQEDAYFESLAANKPNETNDHLFRFIALARDSVDIRARFRALDKIEEYNNRFVKALDTRIRDVELNREALVKGVKVIDVVGSDIDLIIPESRL